MSIYNVSKIKNIYKNFTDSKTKFDKSYKDYKSGYIYTCNDPFLNKIKNKLNEKFNYLDKGFKKVNQVLSDYVNDVEIADLVIAGEKTTGSIRSSNVASKLKQLGSLANYSSNIASKTTIAKSKFKEYIIDPIASMTLKEYGCSVGVALVAEAEGVVSVFDNIADGILYYGGIAVGEVVGLFDEEAAKEIQDIAKEAIKDDPSKYFSDFYNNTSIGQYYMQNSNIKQGDSLYSFAKGYGSSATKLVVATACPNAMSAGLGFFAGSGESAEQSFKNGAGYYDDALTITLNGTTSAIDWYGQSRMGKNMVTGIDSLQNAVKNGGIKSIKDGIVQVLKTDISGNGKKIVGNIVKDVLKDPDTYLDSFSAAFNNIKFSKNPTTGKMEINIDYQNFSREFSQNLVMNIFFSSLTTSYGTASGLKNVDGSNIKNAEISSSAAKPKIDNNLDSLGKEYDELLATSKEDWFVKAKEARDNGWAWNLKEVDEVDNIVKRMGELEGNLGIKNTGVPESKIYDYSGAKKEADALVDEIRRRPIPGFENIDTNSQEYKKAMQEIYSKPSPSGKQDLSQVENPFDKKNIVKFTDDIKINKASNIESSKEFKIVEDITGGAAADKNVLKQVDEILDIDINNLKNADTSLPKNNLTSASNDQFLGNQSYDFSRQGSGIKTIKDGNDFYINSKTFTVDDMKSINKNSRFKKTIVYITDDTNPSIIFQQAKKPKNIVVRVGDFEYLSDGKGIRINQWRNTASVEPIKSSPVKSINQTNFEDEVGRTAAKLADDYNYLYFLKEDGTLEELIRQGQKFDSYTGVKLTDVDATLEKYPKRIDDLQDLVFKDDVVMTSRQRNLYDAMNDSIEKLNKQFGAEYGPDIGIRQVTAYANGEVDLNHIPRDYRDVIKDYSYDELQEYFLVKKQIEICNEFSKNGKMTDNYTNTFSRYVDADKIAETKNVNILLTDEAFEIFYPEENAMAFNNGTNSYMSLKYSDDIIKANMSHENIHQMSSNNGISGIHIDERHRGINETFTEYLNNLSLKSDYPKKPYCGYQPMVDRLDLLVQKGIFTNDDIMNAYFNNDISPIKNKVNQLAGSDNYYDNFVAAFQNAHDNNQYNDLDTCCMDLDYWNSRKTTQRDFGDTLDLSEITQEIPIQ